MSPTPKPAPATKIRASKPVAAATSKPAQPAGRALPTTGKALPTTGKAARAAVKGERPLSLRFVQSATTWTQLPETTREVAFVGRSNVGKSSLINAVAGRKALALVSKTPGRTRVINLFAFDRSSTPPAHDPASGPAAPTAGVIDLPGYGYATVSAKEQKSWRQMIEGYLLERPSLDVVLVLVDGEIGPTKLDQQMLAWLRDNEVDHRVIATKADKVKATKRDARRRELAKGCYLDTDDVLWVSAAGGAGIDDLRRQLRLLLDPR